MVCGLLLLPRFMISDKLLSREFCIIEEFPNKRTTNYKRQTTN